MDKQEEEYQYKTKIQSLIQAAGMIPFKADINDCVNYANGEIDKSKNKVGFISESGLSKLNYDLGRKSGLEMVLNILQGYEDDLIGDDVKPPKK